MNTQTLSAAQTATREAHRHDDGEFGTQPHAESGLVETGKLDARQLADQQRMNPRPYGDVTNVQEGSRTPWGAADQVEHLAPGIVVVYCPGHGGIKLSPERNAAVPTALRQKSGWYEEDCEAYIVAMTHPEAYPNWHDGDLDEIRTDAATHVKDWFPDEYTKATGVELTVDESWTLKERAARADVEAFRQAHADDLVSTGQGSSSNEWVPAGYTLVEAECRTTGEKKTLMVRDRFWSRSGNGSSYTPIVITDAEAAVDVTGMAGRLADHYRDHYHPQIPKIHDAGVSYAGLTTAQRHRAEKDLTTIYRLPDGKTGTIVDYFNQVGVTGKKATYYSGDTSPTYNVELGGNTVHKVSKAAYEALTGIPDTADPVDKAIFEASRIESSLTRLAAAQPNFRLPGEYDTSRFKRAQLQEQLAAARTTQKEAEEVRRRPTKALLEELKGQAFSLVADRIDETDD